MIAGLDRLRERYDAILLDVDGTLLDGESRLTPRTRKAVRALHAAGFEVILCTGRSETGTVPFYRALGLDGVLTAYDGAWIGRPGATPWRCTPIPDACVSAVAGVEAEARFSFRHNGGKKHSLVRRHPLYGRVAAWYSDVVLVESEHLLPRRSLMRVSCYFDEPAAFDRAWLGVDPVVHQVLHRDIYAMQMFPEFRDAELYLGEIRLGSRGKAEVYEYLGRECSIPPERVVAVGDHDNDVSMLQAAGLAVAMGNATEAPRRVAHLVIGTHDAEGLATWVEAGAPQGGAAPARRREAR